jgi:hypothetical protein
MFNDLAQPFTATLFIARGRVPILVPQQAMQECLSCGGGRFNSITEEKLNRRRDNCLTRFGEMTVYRTKSFVALP